MKAFSILILSFIIIFSCGQTKTKFEENGLSINIDSVNQIYISGYCGPLDTCIKSTYRVYQLNVQMSENLIYKLNKSISKDPCNFDEYWPEYVLYIQLKDGAERNFKMYRETIKEDDIDACFDFQDSDYFKNLWTELDNKWLELNEE